MWVSPESGWPQNQGCRQKHPSSGVDSKMDGLPSLLVETGRCEATHCVLLPVSLPSSWKPCSPLGSARCFSPAAPWALLGGCKHGALGVAGLLGHSQGGRALLCSLFLNCRAYQNPGLSGIRAAVLSPPWGNGEVMWARSIYLGQRETHAQVALDGSQMPARRWTGIKLWRQKWSWAEKGSRVKVTREVHASGRECAEVRLVSVLQGHLEGERGSVS